MAVKPGPEAAVRSAKTEDAAALRISVGMTRYRARAAWPKTGFSLIRPLFLFLYVFCVCLSGSSSWYGQNGVGTEQQIGATQSTMDDAVARVKAIVNQPVDHRARTSDMRVTVFSPGWFH